MKNILNIWYECPVTVWLHFSFNSPFQIPQDKLLAAFERSLVDVTNAVGVDMNKAVGHVHYRALLPFISGLGPRKAEALVKKIEKMVRSAFYFGFNSHECLQREATS